MIYSGLLLEIIDFDFIIPLGIYLFTNRILFVMSLEYMFNNLKKHVHPHRKSKAVLWDSNPERTVGRKIKHEDKSV